MKNIFALIAVAASLAACEASPPSAYDIEAARQETIRQNMVQQVGLPAIVNFTQKRDLKDIYEMLDQPNLVTYSYVFSPMKGCFVFLGISDGMPIPYATQFTAPYTIGGGGTPGYYQVPQSEPSGLYPPGSAGGTWVKLKDPEDPKASVKPSYIEDNVSAFHTRRRDLECK